MSRNKRNASKPLLRDLCRSWQFYLYCSCSGSSTAFQQVSLMVNSLFLGKKKKRKRQKEVPLKTKPWRKCFSSRHTAASRWNCPEAVAATTSWSQGARVLQQGEGPTVWRRLACSSWNEGCASCRSTSLSLQLRKWNLNPLPWYVCSLELSAHCTSVPMPNLLYSQELSLIICS